MGIGSDLYRNRIGQALVLDLADRKVVGWVLSESIEAAFTTMAAWQMALNNSPLSGSMLFQSDRGVQYACSAFRKQLEGMTVVQCMSRKDNCWDNDVAESFFQTLKTELIYHCKFTTRQEAWLAIFEYAEIFYNKLLKIERLAVETPLTNPSSSNFIPFKNRC